MNDKPGRRTYLIQDPFDTDALRFIDAMFRYFGLRPVCFYTDPKARFYGEHEFPILRTEAIEAAFDVDLDDLASFAATVSESYDVLTVIPYREDVVEVAAELCGLLDLKWNDAATVARFRDKHALKTYVHERDPCVRVPCSRIVTTLDDVFDDELPDRFVIKPNDGFGNREVTVFDSSQRAAVEAKLRDTSTTWILEEYIDGEEYEIDGQVRPDGTVDVIVVSRYNRVEANGYSTVYHSQVQLWSHDPIFQVCADYAKRLITASGLRASPFHMEAKIDEHGPAMVDLGARLPSEGGGDGNSRLHPTRPDVYTVAVHDYLGVPFETGPIDWTHYDEARQVFVFGISYESGRIGRLEGVEEVESMVEFVHWAAPPKLGQAIRPTTELHGAPYVAALRVWGDDAELERVISYVHDTVRWTVADDLATSLVAAVASIPDRLLKKSRWVAHQILGRVVPN